MPEFLAKTGYVNPLDVVDGVFQYTKSSTGTLFNYYRTHPKESTTFNAIMGGVMAHQASWLDIYPHETLLDSSNEGAILVDIGGNVGRDLDRFRAAHPEVSARLVLQDRPEVVADAICPPPVKIMPYDFFKPQPVKGKMRIFFNFFFKKKAS